MCFCVQINHTRKELLFLMFQEINLRNHPSLHKLFYGLHSIKALNWNDILINIIFRNDINFSLNKIKNFSKNTNIQSKFLLSNKQFSKYLIYRSTKTESHVQILANLIIEEYFHPKAFSNELMKNYLNTFLILLSRNTILYSTSAINKHISNLVLNMLKEITQNYQTVSLNTLAKKTNYNRSYLGAPFKKELGILFSKALTEQRLLVAYNLLTSSSQPISEIVHKVGMNNKTFFYKKFQQKFDQTPNEVREQNKEAEVSFK